MRLAETYEKIIAGASPAMARAEFFFAFDRALKSIQRDSA
jgi:hypothetical protein